MAHLRERLPDDAVITNGAGNYTVWAHRFYEFHRYGTQLAPCAGAMGYGIPAAIAAKLLHPERPAVCLSGDGDFLMSGHELATAMQYGAAIVVLVVNNGMLGTIRMHQERQFGRGVAHRPRQPGLRRVRQGIRSARGAGRAKRGLPGRVRGGARRRPPGAARAARRPRGDHPESHAQRAARPVASRSCASCSGRQPTTPPTSSSRFPSGP